MQAVGNSLVIASQILPLVVACQVAGSQSFEPDKDTAQSSLRCPFNQVATQDRIHSSRSLEESPYAFHALKQCLRKSAIAEQVVIEEIKMPSRQARNLRQRIVHPLRVKRAPSLKEGVLVAKIAVLWTSTRDHNRIRHQIQSPPDQISPHRGNSLQRAPVC